MNKISLSFKTLFLMAGIVFVGCEDPIDWKVDSDQIKLVVEGRVTNALRNHQVKLTQTADYFSSDEPAMVEGAQVVVNDGINIYTYEELSPGIYTSVDAFEGIPGRKYSLAIELSSPLGGSSVFTASSKMLPPMKVDSLYSVKQAFFDDEGDVSKDSTYVLGFYGQEVQDIDNSYFFDVFINDFKDTDNVVNLGHFDDEFLEDDYLKDFLLYEVEKGNAGDSITVMMHSVEDEYRKFIEGLVVEIEGSEPLGFNGPPANVVGNLSNQGLGYFYTASVDTVSTILK